MYKFEIYKSKTATSSAYGQTDFTRYAESSYAFEREINPIWNDLGLKYTKENGRVFFRKQLEGDITLVDNDYDWAYSLFGSQDESNAYRYLKVSEKIDGLWVEVWRGYFSMADGEYNISKCFVVFTDLLVFDEYSPVLESIDKEKNMINVAITHPVTYPINEYLADELVETFDTVTIDDWNGVLYYSIGDFFKDIKYTKYERKYRLTSARLIESDSACTYSATFVVTDTWRRDYQWAAGDPGIDWEDSGEPLDINGNSKWVRYYRGDDTPAYQLVKTKRNYEIIYTQNCAWDSPCCSHPTLYEATYTFAGAETQEYENERGRLFSYVVDYSIDELIQSTKVPLRPRLVSEFLFNPTNPISQEANTLNNLIIWQLSDVKRTSDAATVAMYSYGDVENMLLMFNAYWYINDDGAMQIEHLKYFDNGLSYSGTSYDIDITSGIHLDETKGLLVVGYTDDLPQQESHKFNNAVNPDFVGTPIIYHGNIVDRKEGSGTREYNFQKISADLNHIVSNPDDVGKDGFLIAATELNESETGYDVLTITGILSGVTLSNGYMAVSHLQDYYWKWGRSMPSGIMNTESTEFTQKNVIIQTGVTISNCADFNPYKLVKTEYGLGRIEEAIWALKDKKLTLTLSYGT